MYIPKNYEHINAIEGTYNPSMIKAYNNEAFNYWERSLFQRASSVLEWEGVPDHWSGNVFDFFIYCLYKNGFVGMFEHSKYGLSFQPCGLKGYDFYYQPTNILVTNPALDESLDLELGKDAELIKLTPDYRGIWDIISYYAEKLAVLDNAINISLINNKFAYILTAKNKASAEALKKMLDKINKGEPAVIADIKLTNDRQDKDMPFQFLERGNLKDSYLTPLQLQDMQTLINSFDSEIGIPTIPYQKKERMVQSEAESKQIDSTSRCTVWMRTLQESLDNCNKLFNTNISVKMRFNVEGGAEDEFNNTVDNGN